MFENILHIFKKNKKIEGEAINKEKAKERLHLVLMQDRANVSADFLDMMKQEIIEVIKKYIDVDEDKIDVKLTNKLNGDGTTGAPALYANIPIVNIKKETRINSNMKKLNEMSDGSMEKNEEENKLKDTKKAKINKRKKTNTNKKKNGNNEDKRNIEENANTKQTEAVKSSEEKIETKNENVEQPQINEETKEKEAQAQPIEQQVNQEQVAQNGESNNVTPNTTDEA